LATDLYTTIFFVVKSSNSTTTLVIIFQFYKSCNQNIHMRYIASLEIHILVSVTKFQCSMITPRKSCKPSLGCPTLLKPLLNFMLIHNPINYDKLLDIPDFQNFRTLFTILQLRTKYTSKLSGYTKKFHHIIFFKISISK
jgi:hypothetical protein